MCLPEVPSCLMSEETSAIRPVEAHEHVWKYHHTYDDWWDGDSDDIYHCTVPGCTASETPLCAPVALRKGRFRRFDEGLGP